LNNNNNRNKNEEKIVNPILNDYERVDFKQEANIFISDLIYFREPTVFLLNLKITFSINKNQTVSQQAVNNNNIKKKQIFEI
jgi:hypothetical protein